MRVDAAAVGETGGGAAGEKDEVWSEDWGSFKKHLGDRREEYYWIDIFPHKSDERFL